VHAFRLSINIHACNYDFISTHPRTQGGNSLRQRLSSIRLSRTFVQPDYVPHGMWFISLALLSRYFTFNWSTTDSWVLRCRRAGIWSGHISSLGARRRQLLLCSSHHQTVCRASKEEKYPQIRIAWLSSPFEDLRHLSEDVRFCKRQRSK
jgi:hypothetical protein